MFVVQVGHFAWLNAQGVITTSGAHAHAQGECLCAGVAKRFTHDRKAAMANCNAKQREFYLTAPVTVVPLAELQERLAKNASPRTTPVAATADPAEPKPAKAPGVTAQIRQWALDNPQASRADALAAFPDANPSTVSVQFGAARKNAN